MGITHAQPGGALPWQSFATAAWEQRVESVVVQRAPADASTGGAPTGQDLGRGTAVLAHVRDGAATLPVVAVAIGVQLVLLTPLNGECPQAARAGT
jgi:hypothetical protein